MHRSLLAVVGIFFSVSASAFAYAEEPFKTSAIEPARVLVEAVGINNWLNANHARMGAGQTQGAREHLHALIDSRVKELYAKNGALMPKEPDPILAMLFAWAGRLGVYGADAVYSAVRGTYIVKPPPGPYPPAGLSLALQNDTLVISSSAGEWQASIPYHFFIFNLSNGTGSESKRTEVAVISTGSARDVAPPGYSQATLAVFFTDGARIKTFESEWAERLQIALQGEQAPVGHTKYRSRKSYDELTRLHKEVVFVPSRKGAFAILYSGLDGTYQANRPHFLSFLEAIKLPE